MNPRELAEKWVTNKDKEAFLEDVHSMLDAHYYNVIVYSDRRQPEEEEWYRKDWKAPKPEDTNASNQ